MARRDDLLGIAETIIGAGVSVKGNLISEGDIMIDAQMIGAIRTSGNLSIGGNATIKGDVAARNVEIAGQLDGNISCEDVTRLLETARVKGDVKTGSLAIAQGAIFVGVSSMSTPDNPLLDNQPSEKNNDATAL